MKNLSKHKDKVNARELLVQALYEFSFGHNDAESIEESFRNTLYFWNDDTLHHSACAYCSK